MFSWLKRCLEREEVHPCEEAKSSLKKTIYAAFEDHYVWQKDYGCEKLGPDGKPMPWADNRIELFIHNDSKLIPLFHYFMDEKEVCESLPVLREYHDGTEYRNVRVADVRNNRDGDFIIVLTYEERRPYHKETSLEKLREMFSDYSVLSTEEYMMYKEDLLNYGYWFEPRGKKLYLREPKELNDAV